MQNYAGRILPKRQTTKTRGLNRHQTYPFVGQAMPWRVQKHDAWVLKKELHCNIVRTSHYPQSTHFLDACDELGLLVFEEIPGWQHIAATKRGRT
jgi:beta-galactosidase